MIPSLNRIPEKETILNDSDYTLQFLLHTSADLRIQRFSFAPRFMQRYKLFVNCAAPREAKSLSKVALE